MEARFEAARPALLGTPDLLRHLRDAGPVLTPTGGLHVAPRSALSDDHRGAIRAARDALVQRAGSSRCRTSFSVARASRWRRA